MWLEFLWQRGFLLHFFREIKDNLQQPLMDLLLPAASTSTATVSSSSGGGGGGGGNLATLYLYESIFAMFVNIANPSLAISATAIAAVASASAAGTSYGATLLLNLGAVRILSQCTYFRLQPDPSVTAADYASSAMMTGTSYYCLILSSSSSSFFFLSSLLFLLCSLFFFSCLFFFPCLLFLLIFFFFFVSVPSLWSVFTSIPLICAIISLTFFYLLSLPFKNNR